MTQPIDYGQDNPLTWIINFLEKQNEDLLASKVIDVFARTASNLEELNLVAKLYLDVRDIPKAEEYALKVLHGTIGPEQKYNARANLGKMYNNVNEPEKSLFYSKLNRIVNTNDTDTLLEMVFSYYLLNQKDEAETILRDLKSRENDLTEKHRDIVNFNLGTYDLEQGKFIEGLKGFMIKGRKLKIWFSPRELPYKFWDGGAFPGKTLILFAEGGGIGDEMLSVRFMDDLKEMGFDPVFYTSRIDLYNIFNRNGYKAIMTLDNIPQDSLWTYFMQVPIFLNANPDTIVRSKYLQPAEDSRNKWSFVKESKKLKVGIRWQGNAKNERDLHRKVPLEGIMKAAHEAFAGHEVEYYSLQIGDGVEDMKDYPELIDISDKISSYDDTMALMENLDYVITSCTSVVHASAIVGTKTMVMVPISAYFTWVSPPTSGRPSNSSIWYDDNLRIFRQVKNKNWDQPFEELVDYIKKDLDAQ